MPLLGVPSDYGAVMLVSSIVMMSFNAATWMGGAPLVSDLDGEKAITYELSLPLPYWLVFIKVAFSFAVNAIVLNILTLAVGKLLLFDRFDLSNLSIIKFTLMYICSCVFFGFFALWVTSWVRGMHGLGRFYLRIATLLIFFGGFQFAWITLFNALPWLGYANLLNPFTYACDGLRAAVLGQEGYLNFWLCTGMLLVFTLFFAVSAIYNFKRRLDCVG
jgi:ABC-type multidrug transport system permease subunit